MAGEEIQETECYKYLGVELVGRLDFKKLKERYVAEARKRMMLVWAMGMRGVAGHRLLHGVECACETCA